MSGIGAYLAAFLAQDSEPTLNAISQSTSAKAWSGPVWQTVVETELPAAPAEVYRFRTDQAYMRRWLYDDVEVDATDGGSVRTRSGEGEEIRGRFRHLAPGAFVSYSWTFITGEEVPLPPGKNESPSRPGKPVMALAPGSNCVSSLVPPTERRCTKQFGPSCSVFSPTPSSLLTADSASSTIAIVGLRMLLMGS